MEAGGVLRVAARAIAWSRSSRVAVSQSRAAGQVRRPFSANTAAKAEQPAVHPKEQRAGQSAIADAGVDTAKKGTSSAVVETPQASAAKKNGAEKTAASSTEKASTDVPDVSSTSLGLEDPMTNDPLKWRKFAYKYAGALLLFFVSYKSLHWYVDRLEADGKRRREELEENKTIIQGMDEASDHPKDGAISGVRGNPATVASQTPTALGENNAPVGLAGAVPQAGSEGMPALRVFDSVKQEEPHLVSELEELCVYRIELERKLVDLDSQGRTSDTDAERQGIEADLKQTEADIAILEAKNKPQ